MENVQSSTDRTNHDRDGDGLVTAFVCLGVFLSAAVTVAVLHGRDMELMAEESVIILLFAIVAGANLGGLLGCICANWKYRGKTPAEHRQNAVTKIDRKVKGTPPQALQLEAEDFAWVKRDYHVTGRFKSFIIKIDTDASISWLTPVVRWSASYGDERIAFGQYGRFGQRAAARHQESSYDMALRAALRAVNRRLSTDGALNTFFQSLTDGGRQDGERRLSRGPDVLQRYLRHDLQPQEDHAHA